MKIRFRCSYCHTKFKARREKAGQKVKCGRCGTTIVIPKSASAKLTLIFKKATVNPSKNTPNQQQVSRSEPLNLKNL